MIVKPSLIAGAGKGLFASRDYKKGEFIGEYYGELIDDIETAPEEKDLYLFTLRTGKIIVPHDECLCMFANDAIDLKETTQEVLSWLTTKKKISSKDIENVLEIVCDLDPITHCDETTGIYSLYNLDWRENKNKLFLKAILPIKKGEEFYIFYGWSYWREILLKMVCEIVGAKYN